MDFLYNQLISGKQKAVVGFVATALVAFLAKHGVVLPNSATDVFQALLWGLLGLGGVYLKKNKK